MWTLGLEGQWVKKNYIVNADKTKSKCVTVDRVLALYVIDLSWSPAMHMISWRKITKEEWKKRSTCSTENIGFERMEKMRKEKSKIHVQGKTQAWRESL